MNQLTTVLKVAAAAFAFAAALTFVFDLRGRDLGALPHRMLLPGAIALLMLALGASAVDYAMTRPDAAQNITAHVNIGSINAPNGTVTITAVKIENGDTPAERERKIATARSLLVNEIVFNVRSLDSRNALVRAATSRDEFDAQLRARMRDVAPVVAEINADAYSQLLSQQAAASLRQAFASAPLRADLTDFIVQVVTTADAPPDRVRNFYRELTEAAYRSDVVLQTLDAAARKPDAVAARRVSLAQRGLELQSRLAFLHALGVLDAIPGHEPALDTLQILRRPRSVDAEYTEIARALAELLREKAALGGEFADARDRELVRAIDDVQARLTIAPTDRWNEVVGKAITLRQLGRSQDAERAFMKYEEMFGATDPGARLYATTARALTRQARELGVHGGVYLFEVTGGAASAAGLRRGDIITSYGKLPVLNPHDLSAAIASHPGGPKIPVQGLRYREDTKRLEPLSVTVSPGKLGAGLMPI